MRIGIIGSGVAGLGAAYLLAKTHDVEVFERSDRAGGHVRTIQVPGAGGSALALDIGFIVHNLRHYPNLVRLFHELDVRTQGTQMSFAVSAPAEGVEYCASRIALQPRLIGTRRMRSLVLEILRFMRRGRAALDGRARHLTLGEYVARERFSPDFGRLFLVPLAGALWSTALPAALAFPADYALRFLDNHGLLSVRRQHWRTVTGGARHYVQAILNPLGARVHLGLPVRSVTRGPDGVRIVTDDAHERHFDAIVIATHANQALALLTDASPLERRLLGAFPYTRNEAVLHTDDRVLPRSQPTRGAWNYQVTDAPSDVPAVTYYLNRLQRLDEREHYCVTLNRTDDIRPERILHREVFHHPRYTFESLRAQGRLHEISSRRTWFCGAYHGNGFHEAGLVSGIAAARGLGVRW